MVRLNVNIPNKNLTFEIEQLERVLASSDVTKNDHRYLFKIKATLLNKNNNREEITFLGGYLRRKEETHLEETDLIMEFSDYVDRASLHVWYPSVNAFKIQYLEAFDLYENDEKTKTWFEQNKDAHDNLRENLGLSDKDLTALWDYLCRQGLL